MYSLDPLTGNVYLSPRSTNLSEASYSSWGGFGVVVNVGLPSAKKTRTCYLRTGTRFLSRVLLHSRFLQGLMKTLCELAEGVLSCCFSFRLAEL